MLKSWFKPMRTNRLIRRDIKTFVKGLDPQLTLDAAETLKTWHNPVLLLWADAPVFPLRGCEFFLARRLPEASGVTGHGAARSGCRCGAGQGRRAPRG
ncbi:MAG: hypothetical protein ACI9MR_004966, partial [Myxococcota bacterium]